MKVSIFGMGYVGCVTAACLAHMDNEVFCVEVVQEKVRAIREGRWPIYERGLDQICEKDEENKFPGIKVTMDSKLAISETGISLVCVGTPDLPDGRVDLTYLRRTITEIARAIRSFDRQHILVIRSTVPPGTTEGPIASILDEAGVSKKCPLGVYPNS